ncbi:MAG: TatD family hydrolase [Planctomycetota bacterium]
MRICDPHCHMYARTTDDYERMALAGIVRILEPAFWLGQPRRHAGTFFDYFDHLLGFEHERAAQYGIDQKCAIALNPRESNEDHLREQVLARLPQYLAHKNCTAVGEIGFDDLTDAEEESIRRQLEIAFEEGKVVLVHSAHRNKLESVERTIGIIKDLELDESRILIDHNTEETIGYVKDHTECWAGHTVYPVTKLSPERAADIFERHGVERMCVNSSCDWGPSDPLSVPKTVLELRRRGFSERDIETLVWTNPSTFYGWEG